VEDKEENANATAISMGKCKEKGESQADQRGKKGIHSDFFIYF
jgi:hypothetical protein